MAEARRAEKDAPEAAPPKAPEPKLSKAEAEAKVEQEKVEKEYAKLEEEAIAKSAKINQNLAKDGSPNRVTYQVRNGEIKYTWANTVPTRELTPEETEAAEKVRA